MVSGLKVNSNFKIQMEYKISPSAVICAANYFHLKKPLQAFLRTQNKLKFKNPNVLTLRLVGCIFNYFYFGFGNLLPQRRDFPVTLPYERNKADQETPETPSPAR